MWYVICIGFMTVAFLVLRFCRTHQHTFRLVTPTAIGATLVALLSGFGLIWHFYAENAGDAVLSESKAWELSRAQGFIIGKNAGEHGVQADGIVILCRADQKNATNIQALAAGVGEAFDLSPDRIRLVGVELLNPPRQVRGDPEDSPDWGRFLKARDFNAAFDQAGDAALVLVALDLPPDANRIKVFRSARKPAIYLVNVANPERFRSALAGHVFAGLTAVRTDGELESAVSRDPEENFDSRYVLLTPENIRI